MNKTIAITKALSDKNRVRIIIALKFSGEICVCRITELLKLSTPTVSRHISILENAHLVQNTRKGKWKYFRISKTFPKNVLYWLETELSHSDQIKSDKSKMKTIMKKEESKICPKYKKNGAHLNKAIHKDKT